MSKEKPEAIVPAYTLGALDNGEHAAIEKHLQENKAEYRESIQAFGKVVSKLLFGVKPVAPRPQVKDNILSRIKEDTASIEGNPFFFLKADEGAWESLGEGVIAKILFKDAVRQTTTMLMRMEAGSVIPGHTHHGAEELFLLEGDCLCAGEI
ncbi:MAG: cupin domain-containing protein, partial [bacterium]